MSPTYRTVVALSFVSLVIGIPSCKKKTDDNGVSKTTRVARCTHSVGLCNLPLFITKEDETTKDLGLRVELINIPNWGDHAAALTSGRVDFSVTPFTNVMTAYANGAPIRIIAGSGINGLHLLGSRNIHSVSELRGKRVGTFQADTLELLLFAALQQNQMDYDDLKIVYFTDAFELINAFGIGRVDAMTHVEPYAQRAVADFSANRLVSGEQVWRGAHPDCVLTASDRILKDSPETARDLILGMMRAQLIIENNRERAVDIAVGKYYKAKKDDIMHAARSQPPGVDIRHKLSFMRERFEDLKKLRYVADDDSLDGLIDFSFLKQVIADNPDVHNQLVFRSTE